MSLPEGIATTLVLVGCAAPIIIIGFFYYLKKRLDHKQIIAAIEKGTPLSELRGPKRQPAGPPWIKYVSFGVGMLVIAIGFVVSGRAWATSVIAGIGACWLTRGLLHRKYYMLTRTVAENASASELSGPTVRQTMPDNVERSNRPD